MKKHFPIVCLFSCLIAAHSFAGSATWSANPTSGDWNTAANWTPATVPNGPADIATFDVSNITKVSVSADIEVDSILFDPGASALTVSLPVEATLNLSGAGLTNNSATMQNFVTGPTADGEPSATVQFSLHASAGSLVSITNNGGMDGGDGGRTNFLHNATAGSATFINNGSTFDASSGWTQFFDQSSAGEGTFIVNGSGSDFGHGGRTLFMDSATAGNGTFIVNGSTVEAFGATVEFTDNSSAGSGTFTINGGSDSLIGMGSVFFQDTSSADEGIFTVNDEAYLSFIGRLGSTAGNATLIANGGPTRGGIIQFTDVSTGGTARVEVFDNGSLNINDNYEEPSLTIGSLEGDGRVRLTGHLLNVGANNLSTIFSGVISNRRGSLGKVGTGTLTLSGTNTYGGGTTISAGVLEVNTASGSGTGTGPVNVLAGTISGRGIIAGPTTIGTGTGGGAFLQPGKGASTPTTLTTQSSLTFKSDSTYTWKVNTKKAKADQVIANGVTFKSGAQFDFNAVGNEKLTTGKVFFAISNTSSSPLNGTFANLSDGSTITVGSNTFQASYEGGDGNDLTLTVVP